MASDYAAIETDNIRRRVKNLTILAGFYPSNFTVTRPILCMNYSKTPRMRLKEEVLLNLIILFQKCPLQSVPKSAGATPLWPEFR